MAITLKSGSSRQERRPTGFCARAMLWGAMERALTRWGIEMASLGFEQTWVVIDLLLTSRAVDLPDRTINIATQTGQPPIAGMLGGGGGEFAVGPDESPEAMLEEAAIWDFLAPWVGPAAARLERKAIYTFKSALARQWQQGRVFIAGDAAHLMPPFMGQGMCAGIRRPIWPGKSVFAPDRAMMENCFAVIRANVNRMSVNISRRQAVWENSSTRLAMHKFPIRCLPGRTALSG